MRTDSIKTTRKCDNSALQSIGWKEMIPIELGVRQVYQYIVNDLR